LKEDDSRNHFMHKNLTVALPRKNCNFSAFQKQHEQKIRMQKCQMKVIITKKFKGHNNKSIM
jgi:hypothetical protein